MGILNYVLTTCVQPFKSPTAANHNSNNKRGLKSVPKKSGPRLPEASPPPTPRRGRPCPYVGGIPKPYRQGQDWASYVHGFRTAMNRSERGRVGPGQPEPDFYPWILPVEGLG